MSVGTVSLTRRSSTSMTKLSLVGAFAPASWPSPLSDAGYPERTVCGSWLRYLRSSHFVLTSKR